MFKKSKKIEAPKSVWDKKADELTMGESIKASIGIMVACYAVMGTAMVIYEHGDDILKWTKRKFEDLKESCRVKEEPKKIEYDEYGLYEVTED